MSKLPDDEMRDKYGNYYSPEDNTPDWRFARIVELEEALVGANWIIKKLAPLEFTAIAVRGWKVSKEDVDMGARYRKMIDAALEQNVPPKGKQLTRKEMDELAGYPLDHNLMQKLCPTPEEE